jgi:hypothetical protein
MERRWLTWVQSRTWLCGGECQAEGDMTIFPWDWHGNRDMSLQSEELLRDRRNIRLLRLLLDNPRIGTSELARCVGMSAPAVR